MKIKIIVSTILAASIVLSLSMSAAALDGVSIVGQATMTQELFSQLGLIGADSAGLTPAIKNAASSAGKSAVSWFQQGFESYIIKEKLTWGTVLAAAQQGVKYSSSGSILFNQEVSEMLNGFFNWAWDKLGLDLESDYPTEALPVNGTVVLDYSKADLSYPNFNYSSVIFGNGSMTLYLNNEKTRGANFNCNCYCAAISYNSGAYLYLCLYFLSDQPITASMEKFGSSVNILFSPVSGEFNYNGKKLYYKYEEPYRIGNESYMVHSVVPGYVYHSGSFVNVATDLCKILFGPGSVVQEDKDAPDVNIDILGGIGPVDINIVKPEDVVSVPDFGGIDEPTGEIDVEDYIGGIVDGLYDDDGIADINITVDDGNGNPIVDQTSINVDTETDIPVDQTTEADIDQDVTGTVEDVSFDTPVTELKPFTMDLTKFFPFCIPFDIYDMATIFVAEPQAPNIVYPFSIPGFETTNIELDLSEFDDVAAVLRGAELVAACIGLALLTKKIIQGGD